MRRPLSEIFDTSAELRHEAGPEFQQAVFEVDGRKYSIHAIDQGGYNYLIIFYTLDEEGKRTAVMTGLAGRGAVRVLSTVINWLRGWVERVKPNSFNFSADKSEESRVNLYDAIIERVAPELVDYKLYRMERKTLVLYEFVRRTPVDRSEQFSLTEALMGRSPVSRFILPLTRSSRRSR